MRREIKFRGKRINNSGWIYGMPTYDFEYILNREQLDSIDNYEVTPETVGQFTGLKDKNEVEVYEGDIINIGEIPDKQHLIVPDIRFMNDILHEVDRHVWLEVIGNIHDNYELLKLEIV